MRAFREGEALASLGRVDLYDADAANRFGETSGDVSVDGAALPEQWAQALEGDGHHPAECHENEQRDRGQLPVEPEEHTQGDRRGEKAADQLDDARADEISHAFGVAHDARDE